MPCSWSGVARISNLQDFQAYARAVAERWQRIPKNTFSTPHLDIEMPVGADNGGLLVEPFIETDPVLISYNSETGALPFPLGSSNSCRRIRQLLLTADPPHPFLQVVIRSSGRALAAGLR